MVGMFGRKDGPVKAALKVDAESLTGTLRLEVIRRRDASHATTAHLHRASSPRWNGRRRHLIWSLV
jgi:hypothetical protein